MTRKIFRDYRAIIEHEGVQILGVERGKRAHIKFRCRYKGKDFLYVCSNTPSDRRDWLNTRAGIRRIIAELR